MKQKIGTSASSFESLVSKTFDDSVKFMRSGIKHGNGPKQFDLLGPVRRRREAAVVGSVERIRTRYAEKCPYSNLDLEWAEQNCAAVPSVNLVNQFYCISMAAAIWMLDELRLTGSIWQAMPYLFTEEAMPEITILPKFYDSCHNQASIQCMIYLIENRDPLDKERRIFINESMAKHTAPQEPFDLTDERSADELSGRERFSAVMGMICASLRERAKQHFEEKLWEYLDCYFEAINHCNKRVQEAQREVERVKQRIDEFHCTSKQQPVLPGLMPPGSDSLGVMRELDELVSLNQKALDKWHEAQNRATILRNKAQAFYECQDDELRMLFDSETQQILSRFEIDDPYELCFGYLCLLEDGSDLPWLCNSAIAVLIAAAMKLPWTKDEDTFDDDEEDYWEDEEFSLEDEGEAEDDVSIDPKLPEALPAEPIDWNEKKHELYALRYTQDALVWTDAPVPTRKVNLPQLVYSLTGILMPRRVNNWSEMADLFEKSGLSAEAGLCLEYYLQLAEDVQYRTNSAEYLQTQRMFHWQDKWVELNDTVEEDTPTVEALTKQLQEQKKINENLRQSVYELSRELTETKASRDKTVEEAANEHRELADLRQIIFQQENDTEEAEGTESVSSFPAEVRQRVVVFGGHDTWLKAIRPMLPNVTFVPRGMRPNADLIRNADLIWIQTNAIAHKDYYSIINVVRAHRIPVRYFLYASAQKCAEQVLEEDRK